MNDAATIRRIAACFPRRWDHHYAAAKLRTDPLYPAVLAELAESNRPLLDLGCGIGLLAFFLRAHGLEVPIHGVDYDARKIDSACAANPDPGWVPCTFSQGDARDGLPAHFGDVTILDILQFFTRGERTTLLQAAAARVATDGGVLVIRSGMRDDSWRHRVTVTGDFLARMTLWMKAAPTGYPTAAEFRETLSPFGEVVIRPLWGRTPFNNHLIVLRR